MHDQFEQISRPFISDALKSSDYEVLQIAGDASNRRYYRVVHHNQSHILMRWEPFDINNYPFLSVLNHFKKNQVHVPEIIAMDSKLGLVLLEDLGDLTLERKFWENQNQELSFPYYQQAIDELIKIHFISTEDKTDCTAFKIQFDTEKLLWEMNYGKDNLLKGMCKLEIKDKEAQELSRIFTEICETLHQQPKFIAHRDYHSRNLMLKLNQMRVIDFQDARLGPIQYDLVSLIRDSYVNINPKMEKMILDYYLKQAAPYLPQNFSRDHFDHIYEIQTIQRCFKACGSFSSFYNLRNDTRYLKYIHPTLKTVIRTLELFPKYNLFSKMIQDSGALERKFES